MKQKDLDDVTAMINRKRRAVIGAKRPQYGGGDDDVIPNFRRRAKTLHTTPESVIISDMSKHFDALANAANNGTFDGAWTTEDGAEGCLQKIGDLINLAELLAGCAVEKEQKREQCVRMSMLEEFTKDSGPKVRLPKIPRMDVKVKIPQDFQVSGGSGGGEPRPKKTLCPDCYNEGGDLHFHKDMRLLRCRNKNCRTAFFHVEHPQFVITDDELRAAETLGEIINGKQMQAESANE